MSGIIERQWTPRCSSFQTSMGENPMGPEMVKAEINGCGLDISSTLPYNETDESYELEFNSDLSQTYTRLDASTNCGWSQRLMWDSDYQYQIKTTY